MKKSFLSCLLAGALFSLWLLPAAAYAGQTSLDAAAGRLLVASEAMTDPRFAESVILLLRHNRQGTVGLVLNNRSKLLPKEMADEIVPGLQHIYFGGPVEPFAVSVLYFGNRPPADSRRILKGIHLTGLPAMVERLEQGEAVSFRVFLGYAAWAPGQLEAELAYGSWLVYPADERILTQENVEQLWQQLLKSGPVISL